MRVIRRRAVVWSGVLLAGLTAVVGTPRALGQEQVAAAEAPATFLSASDFSRQLWELARTGDADGISSLLDRYSDAAGHGVNPMLQDAGRALAGHIAKREEDRAARIAEVRADLDKHMTEPRTDFALSKALRAAIEWHLLSLDKDAVLSDASIKGLITAADAAAHAAEARGDVVTAGELFVLMDALLDVSGTYRADVRRLTQRQEMLRMYVPKRLWELRNERQIAAGEEPLPAYNPFGDDFREKLATVDTVMIIRALARTRQHVESKPITDLLIGGIEAVRTMVTTTDLQGAFPGLASEEARAEMLAFLEAELGDLKARVEARPGGGLDNVEIEKLVNRLRKKSDATVRIPSQALLHEFGNGAMFKLDEFSAIIWPDEVRRFEKNTQGRFVGIGVQIEYDELQNIRVVTPLEDTPAQKAGIHPGDLIKKVDGRVIWGLTLDQAVEVITGPEGTDVVLTLERKAEGEDGDDDNAEKVEVDVRVTRKVIEVPTVKGWRRSGIQENAWDWFIDPENQIGYVRMSQFSDTTTKELDRAVREMKKTGLNGLILDLRFNPGGLLDQAVKVSQRFIDVDGPIVMTQGAGGLIEAPEMTRPTQAALAKTPLVVLINENSASASEIVSGALATYAERGDIDAVVLGSRSYGKGSVQNVWPLTATSMMKVTTAYYMLPDERIIHRRPGAEVWGVEPNLKVEMLPKQIGDAITLRRNADVLLLDENGVKEGGEEKKADPDELVTKGVDLQVETALLLLRSRSVAAAEQRAAKAEGADPKTVTK